MARRTDGLGAGRAVPDRLLPVLVAAMAFLAGLALAGATGATLLAERWRGGAASMVTVQVPAADSGDPAGTGPTTGATADAAADAVAGILGRQAAFSGVDRLDRARLGRLLAPWLGRAAATDGTAGAADAGADAIALPTVFQLRLRSGASLPPGLGAALRAAAPGTTVEASGTWTVRLLALTRSLQVCAAVALLVVALVAVGVVGAATAAGLSSRRVAIEIVHELGAGDGYIAGRFARRATALAFGGGVAGTVLVVPLLLLLCRLAAPFAAGAPDAADAADAAGVAEGPVGNVAFLAAALRQGVFRIPEPLWIGLPLLPAAAAVIGWGTAQVTVRTWLRRLP